MLNVPNYTSCQPSLLGHLWLFLVLLVELQFFLCNFKSLHSSLTLCLSVLNSVTHFKERFINQLRTKRHLHVIYSVGCKSQLAEHLELPGALVLSSSCFLLCNVFLLILFLFICRYVFHVLCQQQFRSKQLGIHICMYILEKKK